MTGSRNSCGLFRECRTFPKLLLPSSSPFTLEKPDSSFPVATSPISSVTDLNYECSCSEVFWLTHLQSLVPTCSFISAIQLQAISLSHSGSPGSSSGRVTAHPKRQCGFSNETQVAVISSLLYSWEAGKKNFTFHAPNLSPLQCPFLVKLCLFIPHFYQQRLTFFSWSYEAALLQRKAQHWDGFSLCYFLAWGGPSVGCAASGCQLQQFTRTLMRAAFTEVRLLHRCLQPCLVFLAEVFSSVQIPRCCKKLTKFTLQTFF